MTRIKNMQQIDILEGLIYLFAAWDYKERPVLVLNSNLGIRIGQEHHIPTMSFSSKPDALPISIFGIDVEYNESIPDDVIGITELTQEKMARWTPARGYRADISLDEAQEWQSRLLKALPEPNGEFKFEGNDYFRI